MSIKVQRKVNSVAKDVAKAAHTALEFRRERMEEAIDADLAPVAPSLIIGLCSPYGSRWTGLQTHSG